MTPKEALKRLHFNKNSLEYCDMKTDEHIMDGAEIDYENILKALTELEELKRYPTSDEVCEAIQKDLGCDTVEYFGGNREFIFFNHGEKQNITDCYGDRYKVIGFYKSSTITLIGRFYERIEKK